MNKNKGFTLIELLAVIVILAILMVIAVPKILNVIENSKKSAAESSIKLVKDAIKTQVTSGSIMETNLVSDESGCYTFNFDDQTSGNAKELQLKNKEKITGAIKYCNGKFSDDTLVFDENYFRSIDYVALAQNKEMLNKTQNTDIVDSEDKRIVVPAGFMITTDTKLVKEGIVIEDKNGNQFVWIEVPNYQEFIDDKEFKDSNYRDLVTEQNYIDMSNSVKKYGGFYIGRYEAGKDNFSKRNEIPYVRATKSGAQKQANTYNGSSNIVPSLMYGVQYDSVLRFISKYDSNKDLYNSTSWGNYDGVSKTLTGFDCYSYDSNWWESVSDKTLTYALHGTGIVEEFKALNIYDLAGNMIEITLEGIGVGRGGGYQLSGKNSSSSAVSRNMNGRFGYRLSFYLK